MLITELRTYQEDVKFITQRINRVYMADTNIHFLVEVTRPLPDPIMIAHGPLTRYVKLRFVHAPGMPGTFSSPPRVSDPDMHHGTCVTHVRWCLPGSLTSGLLWSQWRGNVPGIPGACATRSFTYPVRGPLARFYRIHMWVISPCLSMFLHNRFENRTFEITAASPSGKYVNTGCERTVTPTGNCPAQLPKHSVQ